MSLKIYDFSCPNPDCKFSNTSIEIFTGDNETHTCTVCSTELTKHVPAPVGYVSQFDAARYRKANKGRR